MNDKKRFNITFPAKLLKALRLVAIEEERSIAAVVRSACMMYLKARHPDFFEGFFWFDD